MTEIDRNKFATISRLVGLFGNKVSSDAIRRYIKRYKDYFTVVYDGGVQHVEIESGLKVLTVIHGAIRPGQNRGGHDVLDALKSAGIEPVQTQADSDPPNPIPLLEKEVVVRFSNEDRELIKRLIEKVG